MSRRLQNSHLNGGGQVVADDGGISHSVRGAPGVIASDEGVAPLDSSAQPHTVQYILSMVHDLKKLASRSGLQRVALILEMAELEAQDQIRKPGA